MEGLPRTPTDLAPSEGEALLLAPELLEYVSSRSCDTREECDHIDSTLDRHYRLEGSGYGGA